LYAIQNKVNAMDDDERKEKMQQFIQDFG